LAVFVLLDSSPDELPQLLVVGALADGRGDVRIAGVWGDDRLGRLAGGGGDEGRTGSGRLTAISGTGRAMEVVVFCWMASIPLEKTATALLTTVHKFRVNWH